MSWMLKCEWTAAQNGPNKTNKFQIASKRNIIYFRRSDKWPNIYSFWWAQFIGMMFFFLNNSKVKRNSNNFQFTKLDGCVCFSMRAHMANVCADRILCAWKWFGKFFLFIWNTFPCHFSLFFILSWRILVSFFFSLCVCAFAKDHLSSPINHAWKTSHISFYFEKISSGNCTTISLFHHFNFLFSIFRRVHNVAYTHALAGTHTHFTVSFHFLTWLAATLYMYSVSNAPKKKKHQG